MIFFGYLHFFNSFSSKSLSWFLNNSYDSLFYRWLGYVLLLHEMRIPRPSLEILSLFVDDLEVVDSLEMCPQ